MRMRELQTDFRALFSGRLLAALCALLLAVAPAAAESVSDWSEDHASRARLLDGGADGSHRLAGIEIDLDPGYHTYWRHAGDSGLPPAIDWSGSRNVAEAELLFPAPARFADLSGSFFGYAAHVVLPLRVTPVDPQAPIDLRIALEYGVCKEICIPARADLALALGSPPSEGHPAVEQALARVPRPVAFGDTGPLGFLGVEIVGPDRLTVRVRAPEGATLFAEGPNYRWFLDPQPEMASAAGGEGSFEVEIAAKPREPAGLADLRLTLVGGDDAVESVFTLDAADLAENGR
ncbi:MAG: hypothetical protein EA385_03275 [Salinarimonadaceae bacterium]|nr:MAG: hypothetical protein EA385_03275 [Salinarimonadaceae bacterium]